MTGVDRIRAERQRQVEVEGYSVAHDRLHGEWTLTAAAIAYAIGSAGRWLIGGPRGGTPGPRSWWPFDPEAFKLTPDDRVRELAKAGALIAAAIDAELARLAENDPGSVTKQDRNCTGLTARWCPVHGDCSCPDAGDGRCDFESGSCPLHRTGSTHPDGGGVVEAAYGQTIEELADEAERGYDVGKIKPRPEYL